MAGQQFGELALAEPALVDEKEIVDQHAFLVDGGRKRRHRAGRGAADIGVMAARGDVEEDLLAGVVEDRRDDGDVGQMRAAVVGRVEREDVAGADPALVQPDDRFDGPVHRAEMHGHVRRVGDEPAFAVEDGAGEIEPFLDVDRIGRVLQRHAHLLGDRHEEVVEDLEHDRIGLARADRPAALLLHVAAQDDVVARVDLGPPAGLDDDRLVGLDQQGRAGDAVARRERLAAEDAGIVPSSPREQRPRHVAGGLGLVQSGEPAPGRRRADRRTPRRRRPRSPPACRRR